jgi:hypothetical protein
MRKYNLQWPVKIFYRLAKKYLFGLKGQASKLILVPWKSW